MFDCLTGDFGRGSANWLHAGEGKASFKQMVAQAGHLIPQENSGLTWQLIERWLDQP